MDNLNAFMRLTKADDAQRMVWGILAAEVADHAKEIMDFETAVPAFKSWSEARSSATDGKSLGNIRAQHGNVVAGVLKEITYDPATKTILGKAHILDENEWNKVQGGAYTGFSIGGAYAKRWPDTSDATLTRYTPMLKEISIVDVPCIPVAKFEYVKADGSTEMRKFKAVIEAEDSEALTQGWQAKDGTFFKAKQEAVNHNMNLDMSSATSSIAGALDVLEKARQALAGATEPVEPAVEKAAPSEEDKAEAFKKAVTETLLTKQLCDIPMIVDIIYGLDWLQSNLAMDAVFRDAETTGLPADLKAILGSLCAFLKALVDQGTADIVADSEVAKALSFGQVESLRKFTGKPDLLEGFPEPQADVDPAVEKAATLTTDLEAAKAQKDELEKAVKTLQAGIEEMTKGIADLKSSKDEMAKRLEHLEAQPDMAKGIKYNSLLNGHEGPARDVPVEVDMRKYNGMSPGDARTQMRIDSLRK